MKKNAISIVIGTFIGVGACFKIVKNNRRKHTKLFDLTLEEIQKEKAKLEAKVEETNKELEKVKEKVSA